MNLTGLKGLKSNGDDAFYDASQFQLLLQVERRRTERSKKPFILMLVDLSAVPVGRHPDDELAKLRFVLLSGSRETDIRGWYEQDKIMGIIFTEVTSVDKASIEHILKKVNDTICDCADMEWAKKSNSPSMYSRKRTGIPRSKTECSIPSSIPTLPRQFFPGRAHPL